MYLYQPSFIQRYGCEIHPHRYTQSLLNLFPHFLIFLCMDEYTTVHSSILLVDI